MLRNHHASASDRGASMLLALGIVAVVLGFGAIVIDMTTSHVRTSDRMLQRDQSQLVAELAASEAVGLIVDGASTAFSGTGTASGVDYGFEAEPDGTTEWTVVSWAGSQPDIGTVTVSLTRGEGSGGGSLPPAAVVYALWAEKIESDMSTGTISAPIGASEEIKLEGQSLGTEQHLLSGAVCEGCANPVSVSSHTSVAVPPISSPLACPTTHPDRIQDTTISSGVYLCSGDRLRFRGSVQFDGPVVFVIDDDVEVEFRRATINTISQESVLFTQLGSASSEVKIENSTFVADIVMPNAVLEIKNAVTWVGSVEAKEISLEEATLVANTGAPPAVPADDRYAIWTETLLDIGYVRSGGVEGPIGSRSQIKFWYDDWIGSSQNVVSGGSCINCPNPLSIDGYELMDLPDSAGAAACPVVAGYRLRDRDLAGSYLCDSNHRTLRIRGDITVTEPTVLHIGTDTRLDIRDANINLDGNSAAFVIVQGSVSSWAAEATIDDVVMHGQILTPSTWWWVGDITWQGTFEVDTFWLYDWANINGEWDGVAPPDDSDPGAWEIVGWKLS